jgi:hypothetical protein
MTSPNARSVPGLARTKQAVFTASQRLGSAAARKKISGSRRPHLARRREQARARSRLLEAQARRV